MSLELELGWRKLVEMLGHKTLLSTYYTASCLRKKACKFLQQFGLTDAQFNLMMIVKHQSDSSGLSQAQLSGMMLVNPANITALVDRLEKANIVDRSAMPSDRRCNIIRLTDNGKKLLAEIEPLYAKEIKRIMSVLTDSEKRRMIRMLDKIRKNI